MTRRIPALLVVAAALAGAAPAHAEVAHTVAPGETLWTIAAANNLTTRTVAVYNGLSEDSHVVLGSTIKVPTVAEGAAALQQATAAAPASGTPASSGAAPATTPASAPAPQGAYTVRPGDTLSGLAAIARVRASDIAAMNGLDPSGLLLAGTVLKMPTGSPTPPAAVTTPAPAQKVVPAAAPAPAPGRVTAGDVQSIAAAHGVPASLAAAIAWQESGFNNGMVSSANARGVMQVMPGTWDYVQTNLAQRPLNPASATDNVHAGVLYLGRLLKETGGDERAATAAYYQGLGALRSRGMFDDTKRYVANVQALRGRFGG